MTCHAPCDCCHRPAYCSFRPRFSRLRPPMYRPPLRNKQIHGFRSWWSAASSDICELDSIPIRFGRRSAVQGRFGASFWRTCAGDHYAAVAGITTPPSSGCSAAVIMLGTRLLEFGVLGTQATHPCAVSHEPSGRSRSRRPILIPASC